MLVTRRVRQVGSSVVRKSRRRGRRRRWCWWVMFVPYELAALAGAGCSKARVRRWCWWVTGAYFKGFN